MKRIKDKSGFSLAELLATVAILIILFGIGFVAVTEYQRNLRLNEMDSIAKEIFIAAQNQLSKAKENGTLNQYIEENSKAATPMDNYTIHQDSDISKVYNPGAWNILMPFGSIDDTVRTGGSYIIEFEPTVGTVTQVYYSDNYTFTAYTDELKDGVDDKDRRKRYGESGRNIIGWYRGSADSFEYEKLTDNPVLEVVNGDRLTASISGTTGTDRTVLLCIRSVRNISGQPESETTIPITDLANPCVLDDVTDRTLHFVNRVVSSNPSNLFIPGEDIELFVTVMTSKPNTLSNVLESNHIITNSLFDSVTKDASNNPVAQISNIRHLENLDTRVSDISYGTGASQINITKAEQVDDLNWAASAFFKNKTTEFYTGNRSGTGYCPVDIAVDGFTYEGNDRYIDGITITDANYPAGMFGNVTAPLTVNDLELRNFNIHSAALGLETPYPAGALVGQGTSLTLTNVVAYNTLKDSDTGSEESSLEITSSINAGGLVGSAVSANITGCAAAVYVKSSTGNAGGLVGNLGGGTITDSYFGAHTDNGEFKNPAVAIDAKGRINVYAGTYAGGLVGNGSATITNSYSAGSVYSSHVDAKSYTGLLIGKNPTYTNTGCYGAGWMFEKNGDKWEPIFPDLDMSDFSASMQHPAVYYDDFWKDDYYPYPVISEKNASRTAWFQIQHVGDWALPGYRADFKND